jgi:hypothetical protein
MLSVSTLPLVSEVRLNAPSDASNAPAAVPVK